MVVGVRVEVREERAEEAEDERDREEGADGDQVGTFEAEPVVEEPGPAGQRLFFGRRAPPRFCWDCRVGSRWTTSWAIDLGSGTGTATVPFTT